MSDLLIRPAALAPSTSGTLIAVTPETAGWKYISFAVRRLAGGDVWDAWTDDQEACFVLLRGTVRVSWDDGRTEHVLGPRASVFASYPHAAYVPAATRIRVSALEDSEIADCRAPSRAALQPRIVTPRECGFEIRGGGNATRQIVDILPPAFAADRLLICEVYTPSGNWSSYPPHKHDVDNPPHEVALEETYYFRFKDPSAYAFQRIYTGDGRTDETLMVRDGDLALIHDGYHPFVTAYGYDAYYLNVLAGTRRSMAASDDPQYAAFRKTWPPADPRMPVVAPPAS
jgi:5-deoxy-glucuronate isomerase